VPDIKNQGIMEKLINFGSKIKEKQGNWF